MNNENITEQLIDELVPDEETEDPGEEMTAEAVEETQPVQEPDAGAGDDSAAALPAVDPDDPVVKAWYGFYISHPDLIGKAMPDGVQEIVSAGIHPEIAWAIYKGNERIAAIEEEIRKQSARIAAPGSLMPTASAADAPDPFTEAWEEE